MIQEMLVGLDTNIVDLIGDACASPNHVDAMEAVEPPPRFREMPSTQEVEVFACYWLLALAPVWRSTLYTFSDALYDEVARAPHSGPLLQIAFEVLVRESQEKRYRQPDPQRRPADSEVRALGIKSTDAIHVSDAIGLGCHYFLTNDRQLRNKSDCLEKSWTLRLRRPSEFLVAAVRSGAPWTMLAPWPWESIERINPSR